MRFLLLANPYQHAFYRGFMKERLKTAPSAFSDRPPARNKGCIQDAPGVEHQAMTYQGTPLDAYIQVQAAVRRDDAPHFQPL